MVWATLRALASQAWIGCVACGSLVASCSQERFTPAPTTVGVHPSGIIDPRSDAFHGRLLRGKRWSQMLDPSDAESCGRCHDGAPSRPAGITFSAPGAPACTTCHDQPKGALACNTCHGAGATMTAGAHAAHVEASAAKPAGLPCSTCHPTPPVEVIGGLHGNGSVEVIFEPAVVAPEATYDPRTGACAVSCHDAGGARPRPAWAETTPMGCTGCHGSPPTNHFPGPCTGCHAEPNATGTMLTGGLLHLNGRADLGDGSGLCGACHGRGADPWPTTAAHPAHESPSLTSPIACTSCHAVPQTILDPTHLDGVVHVTFSGLAVARGASPTWDGTSCTSVACHGANLADPAAVPRWADASGDASRCGACHEIPPAQHTASTSCSWSNCHGSEIGASSNGVPFLTASGKSLHVNGVIDPAR